jgi:diguanylate cyclase (GGDEF)-like protein/PAS domain S-box-containing protein
MKAGPSLQSPPEATDDVWVKQRAWYLYLVGAVVATLVYFTTGRSSLLYNAIGLSSALMIFLAVRIHKPEHPTPWYLFALGQFLFVLGDILAYHYELFFHTELPYPAVSDLLYLLVYPYLTVGLLLLVRRRTPGRDWASFIDSLMITVGVGTLSWVFLIGPNWHAEGDLMQRLTSIAYPAMALLLVSVTIRLMVGAGRQVTASAMVLGAISFLFVTDALYGWTLLHTPYVPGSGSLEVGWLCCYGLWGMAALHPSMRVMSERAETSRPRLTWPRLVLLGSAALLPPLLLAIEIATGQAVDIIVVLGATIVLFILVILRMVGLVHAQERSAGREMALREAGQALVTATSAEGIHAAAIEAVLTLAGEDTAVRLCEEIEGTERMVVVASAGGLGSASGARFDLIDVLAWNRERLLANDTLTVKTYESTLRGPLKLGGDDDGTVVVAPLFLRDEFRGVLVVGTPDEMPPGVADSVRALSSQVALALESAALTEDLLVRQSERRFASLVQNSSDIVTVIEPDTSIRYASPSALRVLGFEPSALEGTRFTDLVHPDDRTRAVSFLTAPAEGEEHASPMEFRVRCRDGTYIFAETLRTSLLHDDNVRGIVLNTRDISERKEFEEQLQHQAFHDSVTSLANRALFSDRVAHAIERQGRDRKPIAVLFMDLDDFKTINDSLGHAAGDQLLHDVGERLRECLRTADTAARLGGDEFAILLEDGGDGIQAVDVAERVMRMLDGPFALEGKEVFVRASVGIAVAEGQEIRAAEELLRNADVAMYMAKEKGKGRYQVFEPAMHDTALKRLELKADLQRALEHEEFVLFYQPVIELETGSISGVEALIRWLHPVRGMVAPLDFIPLAEETGLIVPIGRWVLSQACRMAVDLRATFPGSGDFHMAVNLSARQLARPEIVEEVRAILRETGLDPRALILEITESVMMQDMELSIERLTELKGLGIQLAIDDFGTGYSSLNYVRRFPVDILKVDKSFIDGVGEGGESGALTAAVIELAGILNLRPVAEGIERADQLQRLLEMHCDLGQGFYFAKPLPTKELVALIRERSEMAAEIDALAQG